MLEHARGHDSNDADVPGRLTIDDHELSGSIGPCSGSPKGLLKDAALDALAFAILSIELAGERPGLFKLVGKEKIQGLLRVFKTTGCVEARGQLKAGFVASDVSGDLRDFHERK